MVTARTTSLRSRLTPLAACIALSLSLAATAIAARGAASSIHASPAGFSPLHDLFDASGTFRPGATRARIAAMHQQPRSPAASRAVTTCADDGSSGTLRSVVSGAASGDVIDMSQLHCSTITLSTGAINIDVNDLTLQGPGQNELTIDGNHADRVIASYGGTTGSSTLTINDLTLANGFKGGAATVAGGCVYSYANNPGNHLVMNRTTVTGCVVGDAASLTFAAGGGIAAFGTLGLYSSTVSHSRATGPSGAVLGGGGAYVLYASTIAESTITGNSAVGLVPGSGIGVGGGLVSGGTPGAGSSIIRSTISDNVADTSTGGVIVGMPQGQAIDLSVLVSDSTISGNSAPSGANLYSSVHAATSTLALTIRNSTVAFNTGSASCGGISSGGSGATTVDLESSIVANNIGANGVSADICGRVTLSGANNLVLASALPLPIGTISGDPMLGPLQDNGGSTWTHALLTGSPAIDTGNNIAALDVDQRGFARVVGGTADIGAFEVQPDDTIFANGFDP